MTDLGALVTNIELSSQAGGRSTVTFPTLKELSVTDVVAIWSRVSEHVRQQLMQKKPRAVSVAGLGTFHVKKWLSFESGEVLTFHRPVFALAEAVAQIRELQHASIPVPDEMKTVSVSHKKIRSDVPYAEEVVQNCMQETLDFFYFILTNREDADFTLKDLGTLAIRGTAVTMAFSEDFLLTLNKSTYVVEKLLTRGAEALGENLAEKPLILGSYGKAVVSVELISLGSRQVFLSLWQQKWVTSDKEVAFSPSRFGRVHRFPQFEIRAVPRGAAHTDEFRVFESLLSSVGLGVAVHRVLQLLRKGRSPDRPARAEAQEETEEEMERKASSGRLLRLRASRDGGRHRESLSGSPGFPWPAPEHGHRGQKRQSVFGLNSRRKLEASTARWKEKEENRRAGTVTSPRQRAGRDGGETRGTQLPQEEDDESSCDEGQYLQMAWIEARRKFRAELESLGDVKKWLSNKPSLSTQEIRYLRRIKANRRAALEAAATGSLDALVTLQNVLEKQQLRMVDVFLKAAMGGRKIERADFIRVIKETEVPISDEDLEDVAVSLTSSQLGNFIRLEDLIDCQKRWLEMRKEQAQETEREAQFQKTTRKTSHCPPSDTTAKGKKPRAPTKPERTLISLDLPPINAEPERRRVSCEERGEIGKLSQEKRPTQKDTDSPRERTEKSRMARSRDGPVDEHCLPSTVGTDLGELLDRYRRKALVSYLGSSVRCRERDVHITEPTLQRGLLHPGDTIIRDGEDIRRIRQPGGYYSIGGADGSAAASSSGAGQESGSQAQKAKKRSLWRNKKQKSSDNNFWPGHLLDKLCLYFPEKQHDRAHPLFSCVRPTKPAYRCIF